MKQFCKQMHLIKMYLRNPCHQIVPKSKNLIKQIVSKQNYSPENMAKYIWKKI